MILIVLLFGNLTEYKGSMTLTIKLKIHILISALCINRRERVRLHHVFSKCRICQLVLTVNIQFVS